MRCLHMVLVLAACGTGCSAFVLSPSSLFPTPRIAHQRGHQAAHVSMQDSGSVALADGRTYRVFDEGEAVGAHIRSRVADIAQAAILERGAFSMSIGSGTTVSPLNFLKETASELDFSKVHVFFGNERTTGDTAFKCPPLS